MTGTIQPLAVSGSLVLPTGETLTDISCEVAEQGVITVFQTNPNAFRVMVREPILNVECELDTEAGRLLLYAEAGHFLQLLLRPADPTRPTLIGFADAEVDLILTREVFSATVTLFEEWEHVGDAIIDASLTALGPDRATHLFQEGKLRFAGEPLAVDGNITFPTGEVFDLSACAAAEFTVHGIFTNRQGPKPGGKVPANDIPEGATRLEPGSRFNVQTGGANPIGEEEASCLLLTFFGFFGEEAEQVPIAHTLWYTIEGTGQPVTIDTAGSGFDTVIAVYVRAGDELVEVACVDDVGTGVFRSLQAAVTLQTEPGVTYYVQIGGFFSDFGRLRVEVR